MMFVEIQETISWDNLHEERITNDFDSEIICVQIDVLVRKRRNSIANALALRHSCTNTSK